MSKTAIFLTLACVMVIFMIASCASIIHGTKQEISFQTAPTGATAEVTDGVGVSYGSCQTPCTLELKRKHAYKVTFSKEGYASADMVIERSSDGWIWGNILFGGVIGLIIDFTNGAAYKLSPENFVATLSEQTTGFDVQSTDGVTVVFLDLEDLTPEEKQAVLTHEPIRLPVDKIILD